MPFFELEDKSKVEVVMPAEQGRRLTGTCFRGRQFALAGNFVEWSCFADFIHDREVAQVLVAELQNLVKEPSVNKPVRLQLDFGHPIGWSSTIPLGKLTAEDIDAGEYKPLSKRTTALFLPSDRRLAPKTSLMTMVLRMKFTGHWVFEIQTMYPGQDAGELSSGDLSSARGLVWLGWDNPGEHIVGG